MLLKIHSLLVLARTWENKNKIKEIVILLGAGRLSEY
jgi:hypothetical protein